MCIQRLILLICAGDFGKDLAFGLFVILGYAWRRKTQLLYLVILVFETILRWVFEIEKYRNTTSKSLYTQIGQMIQIWVNTSFSKIDRVHGCPDDLSHGFSTYVQEDVHMNLCTTLYLYIGSLAVYFHFARTSKLCILDFQHFNLDLRNSIFLIPI